MKILVLGAMAIQEGEVQSRIGPPQQQATLAALALRPGHVLSLSELITSVWGEDAPESAIRILRTYVWRLRKLLTGDDGPGHLTSVGNGYRLTLPPLSVDAFRAEHLAAQAARAREAGRYDEGAALLCEAISLWWGEPLAGIPGPFAAGERTRLTELRLNLLEERFSLDLLRGLHGRIIPELTAFTRELPLRERTYGFLMRALYAVGRQADALDVYGRARTVLAQELGIDPGPELRDLHERVLSGDPALLPALPPLAAPVPAPAAGPAAQGPPGGPDSPAPAPAVTPGRYAFSRPAQLPPDTPDFSGRAEALATLCQALGEPHRAATALTSISGMGGIGKSTLALRAAHRVKDAYPDGQLYADLRGAGEDRVDPGTVLASFLSALGIARADIPRSLDDRARLFRTVLDGRRVLIMLDNARDTRQVKPLLPGTVHCAAVVTSRARLADVPSSAHVQLTGFGTDEALSLVRRIVGAQRIDRHEPAASALVTACAFLPLAVRIAATRLASRPGWTVGDLVERLADERRRLTELQSDGLAVAAVFELGRRHLTDRQAQAFRRLAPIAWPSIATAAAAAVLGTCEEEAESLLESLVDAAMLESPVPGRYRYHDLVRDFARQLPAPETPRAPRGRPGGDPHDAKRHLLDHLLRRAVQAFRLMIPGDPVHSMLPADRPRPEEPPFRDLTEARAWVVGEFDCAVHLVHLVARDPAADEPLTTAAADLLVALGAYGQDVPYAQMVTAAEALAEAAAARGDDRAAGRAHFICGNAALQATRLTRAGRHTRLAAAASRRAGDQAILQQTYNDLGVIAQYEQRYGEAADHFDRALAIAADLGHRSGELIIMLNAALARIRGGRAHEALPVCDRALEALRAMADHNGVAHALCTRGQALHELARYTEALSSYEECLAVAGAAHALGQQAQARYRRAETLRVTGRTDEALAAAEQAVAYFRSVPDRHRDRGYALLIHSAALRDAARPEQALAQAREAHELFRRAGLPETAVAQELIDTLRLTPSC
ncbi:BTAD domain-containing putative transcriptional regulator [Streptomyces sp. NPDC004284]|uniref:AfsR/SARP family transcriptional regulator n=1 Tax=Streptomyces sp. NPDC004284 TaxID=3364695 RepID=UPI0036B66108